VLIALIAARLMPRATKGSLVWGRRMDRLVGLSGLAVGAWWLRAAAGGVF
jgi:hypothetical protein